MDARAFGSATQLALEIRDRRVGCLELLDFFLARAERHNPALNAIIAWQIDAARQRARDADAALIRGEVWGPLHGIPMTVKESFNVSGLPTTFGNPLWKDNIAASNAVVVDRLLQAGAIVFGKTNVPYMLMDSQSYNDIHGTTNNPWDISRGPGGSSGGEAAVLAAGLSALGAGSDIAGSLRNPAHYCGVYGHKPSWGLIPSRGRALAATVTPADISVVGPMARHAEDIALALPVLAGPDVLQQAAWRLELPSPRRRRLGEFRVAVWATSALSEIDASVPRTFRGGGRCNRAERRQGRRERPVGYRGRRAPPAVPDAVAGGDGLAHQRRGFRSTEGNRRNDCSRRYEVSSDIGTRRHA
jgi:amidase